MSVEKKLWPVFGNIAVERRKAGVNGVILIVDLRWRVVGDEDIYFWKRMQLRFHFRLFKQMMTARFVFP